MIKQTYSRILKILTPKFYIRIINLFSILFPKTVNKCVVFNGWYTPYICTANEIRLNMEFKEIKV